MANLYEKKYIYVLKTTYTTVTLDNEIIHTHKWLGQHKMSKMYSTVTITEMMVEKLKHNFP